MFLFLFADKKIFKIWKINTHILFFNLRFLFYIFIFFYFIPNIYYMMLYHNWFLKATKKSFDNFFFCTVHPNLIFVENHLKYPTRKKSSSITLKHQTQYNHNHCVPKHIRYNLILSTVTLVNGMCRWKKIPTRCRFT